MQIFVRCFKQSVCMGSFIAYDMWGLLMQALSGSIRRYTDNSQFLMLVFVGGAWQ